MLPWDVRRLVAALSNVLSPEQSSYGCFEPSLFYIARFNQPLTNGQQLLIFHFLILSIAMGLCLHCTTVLGFVTALIDQGKYTGADGAV